MFKSNNRSWIININILDVSLRQMFQCCLLSIQFFKSKLGHPNIKVIINPIYHTSNFICPSGLSPGI